MTVAPKGKRPGGDRLRKKEKKEGVQRTQRDRGQVRTGKTRLRPQQYKAQAKRYITFLDRRDHFRDQLGQVRRTQQFQLLTFSGNPT